MTYNLTLTINNGIDQELKQQGAAGPWSPAPPQTIAANGSATLTASEDGRLEAQVSYAAGFSGPYAVSVIYTGGAKASVNVSNATVEKNTVTGDAVDVEVTFNNQSE